MKVISSDFIDTVENTWIDNGMNRVWFRVDPSKIDWKDNEEIFGEIKFVDPITATVVGVFPVTIIKENALNQTYRKDINLNSEQAKRIHLNVDENTKGFILAADLLDQNENRVIITLYNKFGVKIQRDWLDSYKYN